MKKILILIILILIIPIRIWAVSIKNTIIEGNDSIAINERTNLTVKINFSELDKSNKNGMGVALVYYELVFDDKVFGISGANSDDWNTKVYRDKDNKYYAISTLSKQLSDNRCSDKNLYCGDYEVTYELYAKKGDNKESEFKIGDVEIGLLPITDSKKELTEEDVVLINASGKSSKNIKIKDSSKENPGEVKDYTVLKEEVKVTKQMVLDSKDNTYSVAEKDNYIEKIVISGYDLKFKKYINDYTLKINEKDKKLDIQIELSNKDATYEIIGNENLVDNSEIKINVKAKNDEINTYTIKISKEKENVKQEEKKNEFLGIKIDFNKIDMQLVGIIIGGIIGLILLIIIILKLRDRKLEKAIKKL